MKKKLIYILIICIISISIFMLLKPRQHNLLSQNYIDHDITYVINSSNSEANKASDFPDILKQLPKSVNVSQSTSIIDNEDEFSVLGLQFDFNQEVEETKTYVYDLCLIFSIYENLDSINVSIKDNDFTISRRSIEKLLNVELKNSLLNSNTTWQEVKTKIQNIDENELEVVLK